jgi:undecaprenyl-diphosphatase
MPLFQVIILAIVQGLAELLPVSSSAHVLVAEKLMGLDPSSPPMTLLLVMLHTGTMFAVIVYFWQKWRSTYFRNALTFRMFAQRAILATVLTGVVGEGIEKIAFRNTPNGEIEDLFSHLEIIAPALAIAGGLILIAGVLEKRSSGDTLAETTKISTSQASLIGAVQGLCLPFRGLSRSGATISTGMLAGVAKTSAENFSFALAVILTPAVVARELLRLVHARADSSGTSLVSALLPSLLGMMFAFFAGLIALKWLSSWLEHGRWYLFGLYCLAAAGIVETLYYRGY